MTSIQSETDDYASADFDGFIVALRDKVHFSASAVAGLCDRITKMLIKRFGLAEQDIQIRRYFKTILATLQRHARTHVTQLGEELTGIVLSLDSAQHVWIVEFCSQTQWDKGNVAVRTIVYATASEIEPLPTLLLHNDQTAIVYDRSASGDHTEVALRLDNSSALRRIELNLTPVIGR